MSGDTAGFPWPVGSASGAGSMPGADPLEAARIVFGELPDLPYLPELPARGPWADMVGRTAALLTDMPVETTPAGWRLTARPGRDVRRARSLLAADLDALEEAASGYTGPLKVQVCGPWTLAASLELPASQDAALADHGAVDDLVQALAEGVAAHAAEVRRRVPGATLLLQLDEPRLPAVLAGAVPTPSGLRRYPAAETGPAAAALGVVLDAAVSGAGGAFGIVHCCAEAPPLRIIMRSGAAAVSLDLGLLRRQDEDAFAEAVDAGAGVFAGVLQPAGDQPPVPADLVRRITGLWRRLGLPLSRCAGQVVTVPACGLAGAAPGRATTVLAACREAGRLLPEMIEEGEA